MLPLIQGDSNKLEGKVTICADLYCNKSHESGYIGIFASIDLKDIADFLYKRYKVQRGALNAPFEKRDNNCSDKYTKINFYSMGIPRVTDNIFKVVKGDVLDIGNFFDPDIVNLEISNSLLDYASYYLNQNMPHAEISNCRQTPYVFEFNNKKYQLFITSLILPFDHYTKYNDSVLTDIISENYIKPIKKSFYKQNNRIMNELINRFRHFMEPLSPNYSLNFEKDMDAILLTIFSKSKHQHKIINLYLDKILALKMELYEDAAKLRDKIKKLTS